MVKNKDKSSTGSANEEAGRAATRGSGADAGGDTKSRDETRPGASSSTSTLGSEPEELEDTMLCDFEFCSCEEADVVRGAQRFCSEECADASGQTEENADQTEENAEQQETCLCGHAECEASVSAGAGEERGTGRQPSRTPPGRG